MANGTAPIEASSRRVVRHRLNRGGNRQLNRAIHTAALAQISRSGTEGRTYYERCLGRGKDQTRSHPSTQAPHLRPGLDTPPTRPPTRESDPALDMEAQPPAPPLARPATTSAHHCEQQHDRPFAAFSTCPNDPLRWPHQRIQTCRLTSPRHDFRAPTPSRSPPRKISHFVSGDSTRARRRAPLSLTGSSSQIVPRACQSWFISQPYLRVELRCRTPRCGQWWRSG